MMGTTITGEFDNRRDAELSVERLVQDHGIERTDVFIAAAGEANTVGETAAGADVESGHPGVDVDADPALDGMIMVSVDIENDADLARVEAAFEEFGAKNLTKR